MGVVSLASPQSPAAVVLQRRSAGRAWLLSLLVPGSGQLYCGLARRGGLTLGAFVVACGWAIVAPMVQADPTEALGMAGGVLLTLCAFASVDAYFTAGEINRGIDPSVVDNPRVAAVLNVLTNGFGYLYLGEITKGVVFFVALWFAGRIARGLGGPGGAVLGVLVYAIGIGTAVHAYRIGSRSLASQIQMLALPPGKTSSRLPVVIPIVIAAALFGLYSAFVLLGTILIVLGF
jgi:TM2 domain-containing membrane protein YozV